MQIFDHRQHIPDMTFCGFNSLSRPKRQSSLQVPLPCTTQKIYECWWPKQSRKIKRQGTKEIITTSATSLTTTTSTTSTTTSATFITTYFKHLISKFSWLTSFLWSLYTLTGMATPSPTRDRNSDQTRDHKYPKIDFHHLHCWEYSAKQATNMVSWGKKSKR